MSPESMLEALKVDLGITTKAYDRRLAQYIDAARAAIETEGVALDPNNIGDANLVVMYAEWLWKKRDTQEGMPRMLRYQLNNRLFSGKVPANG